ncbi:hypothetical protein C7410_1583 [Paraburkholderia silvatlantica]|uniref:Uncharacterized protein n=1 Tax=Paraburkholderia silvatlantica TaxID=321895 RepID=A0A2V4T1H9_9BURK|nr:hypothetical protein C7410_1583 [Paraburkholderia silvatlantica]TDQ72326.1 hypothetical protein C7412_14925 [Paraburkholderia silvatlantica]
MDLHERTPHPFRIAETHRFGDQFDRLRSHLQSSPGRFDTQSLDRCLAGLTPECSSELPETQMGGLPEPLRSGCVPITLWMSLT